MATHTSDLRPTLSDENRSAFKKYIRLAIGKEGICAFLNHELRILLFENIPGALGIFLRQVFYSSLFKGMGRKVAIGSGVTLRHPCKVFLHDRVVIDDYCALDARGDETSGISIGEGAIISRNTIFRTKNGTIALGKNCGVGSNCVLASSSKLEIGDNLLMASGVYVLAGGEHAFDRADIPIVEQGMKSKGGITIGHDVWIGSNVTILDGVHIGGHAIIGALSLVNKDIPEYAVAYGVPAKVAKDRRKK